MLGNNKDTYILMGINTKFCELIRQKEQGYHPGVEVLIKDAKSLEISSTKLNLDSIEEISAKPGSYRFTGIVSSGFRIAEYYYANESEVEGYMSADNTDVCPIHISSQLRQNRSYISPDERNELRMRRRLDRELYLRWSNLSMKALPEFI